MRDYALDPVAAARLWDVSVELLQNSAPASLKTRPVRMSASRCSWASGSAGSHSRTAATLAQREPGVAAITVASARVTPLFNEQVPGGGEALLDRDRTGEGVVEHHLRPDVATSGSTRRTLSSMRAPSGWLAHTRRTGWRADGHAHNR